MGTTTPDPFPICPHASAPLALQRTNTLQVSRGGLCCTKEYESIRIRVKVRGYILGQSLSRQRVHGEPERISDEEARSKVDAQSNGSTLS